MSVLDTIVSSITPQLTGALASKLGESDKSVQSGLQMGAATMLSTLASRSGEPGFLSKLLPMITGRASAMGATAGSGASSTIEAAESFVSHLFGSNRSSLTDTIAQASGLRTGSVGTILSSAAPLVLSSIGKQFSGGNLSVAALGNLLTAEAPKLRTLLPAGFSPSIFSASSFSPGAPALPTESKGTNWLWILLPILALLIGLGWWFFGRGTDVATKVTETTTAVTDTAKSAVSALGEFFKRKLPNGVELNIPQLGIENKLIDFIESSKPVDETTWFDFDRLLFDTGKNTLAPSSQEQLGNVAQILKAYPKVKIRIGGYTDNTGDKAANLTLSKERASNVMNELVTLGIAKTRMASEGYGEDHPVASNDTAEGRAKNRRISLRVTEK